MNTGQKLVELSGLSSRSALAHLLAITTGTGTGVDRIVFASQFTVSIEAPQMTLVQRERKSCVSESEAPGLAQSPNQSKRADVLTKTSAIFVRTATDEAFITTRNVAALAINSKPPSAIISRKRFVSSI